MDRYNKLIFVSTGGTCRSILAKAIYNNIPGDNKLEAGARGFVVLFNEPVNPKAVAIAKSKGIEIGDEKSQALVSEDFGDDTIIIVMTDMLKKQVYEKFSNALKVYSIREFTNEAIDVESPFGGELVDYGQGYEYLEKLVVKLDLILKGEEEI